MHGESGLDGPDLPAPAAQAQPSSRRLPRRRDPPSRRPPHARSDRAADEHRPAVLAASRRAAGAHRPDGRRHRRGQPDAGCRVQHLGRPRGGAARLRERPRHDDGRPRRHPSRADQGLAYRAHARRREGRQGGRRADGLLRALPRARYPDLDGSPMHDPVCVAHIVDPTSWTCATRSSRWTARPARAGAGRTSTGADASTSASRTPRSALDIDGDRFAELIVERISSFA